MSRSHYRSSDENARPAVPAADRFAYYRENPKSPARGADLSVLARDDRMALLRNILEAGIHGIAFSPYSDGQAPGTEISEMQIRERLAVIQPYVHWIRSFSCTEGNQEIPRIAHENGLKTMAGISLSGDRERNEIEMAGGIEIARAGHVDILAVGNEILLRGDLKEDELIDYIERARKAVPGVPVCYVDAYFLFEDHPRIAAACDVLSINCYPFWESCPAEYAIPYMKDMYRRAQRVANGKPVIISETGWPTIGTAFGAAKPSFDNALEYFIRTYQWADEEGIEIIYFSAFDEAWKTGDEGDVGAYWGLWDKDGNLKYV